MRFFVVNPTSVSIKEADYMPNYEFGCQDCGNEYVFKLSYKELQTLKPKCDCGSPLVRIMSLANVVKKISKPKKSWASDREFYKRVPRGPKASKERA